ncbi:hypothetical protein CPC08DRAFT_712572 [Agrocybe pediades]|nr:hypothetical protein CPC08DRAFT_712572 [Agrocybe pediades]
MMQPALRDRYTTSTSRFIGFHFMAPYSHSHTTHKVKSEQQYTFEQTKARQASLHK